MNPKLSLAAGVLTATVLTVAGCGSNTTSSTSSASPAASAGSAQPSGGPPSGGGSGGGPGGGMQEATAVNLTTVGASPGGANTAEVVQATNAFLATLDADAKDTVEYDFTDNKARQTWSNFPATTVQREGIQLSVLSADQLKAAYAVLQTALSADGYTQDANIQLADDELSKVSSSGASDFGALKDYYLAVYGTPSATNPFMVQFGGHHLARTLTYNGDKVSQTPQFVGSEPNLVHRRRQNCGTRQARVDQHVRHDRRPEHRPEQGCGTDLGNVRRPADGTRERLRHLSRHGRAVGVQAGRRPEEARDGRDRRHRRRPVGGSPRSRRTPVT